MEPVGELARLERGAGLEDGEITGTQVLGDLLDEPGRQGH
jgi:hypothetical protein